MLVVIVGYNTGALTDRPTHCKSDCPRQFRKHALLIAPAVRDRQCRSDPIAEPGRFSIDSGCRRSGRAADLADRYLPPLTTARRIEPTATKPCSRIGRRDLCSGPAVHGARPWCGALRRVFRFRATPYGAAAPQWGWSAGNSPGQTRYGSWLL